MMVLKADQIRQVYRNRKVTLNRAADNEQNLLHASEDYLLQSRRVLVSKLDLSHALTQLHVDFKNHSRITWTMDWIHTPSYFTDLQ